MRIATSIGLSCGAALGLMLGLVMHSIAHLVSPFDPGVERLAGLALLSSSVALLSASSTESVGSFRLG
jgi:hypothetical protein